MSSESETRRVVEALYAAFLAGDAEGMIAQLADDVEVRYLGQASFRGVAAMRRFMEFAAGLLTDLDFRIEKLIVDGEVACGLWRERATTLEGKPWENHGVDVFRVRDGKVLSLHENNDVNLVYEHFPRYVEEDEGE